MLRVLLLGFGALAVGTDSYVTAGLLPAIGRDLHEPASVTGQLVTVFMLSYALLAPLVGAALARWGIRQILLAALALFCLANAATAAATALPWLMAARALAGVAAGVFMPVAAIAAAALVGPERRGRALAVVLGGLSSGTVLGVPAGLFLAAHSGWRSALWLVTAIGAVALTGCAALLPEVTGAAMPSLRERGAQLADVRVVTAVLTTFLQTVASLGLYTYLVPVLDASGATGHQTALWLWGAGGVAGSFLVGPLLDRTGRPGAHVAVLLAALSLGLAALPLLGGAAVLPLLVLWGAVGWAFVVPQQHRLLGMRPRGGAAVLALNSSATYLGGSAGAALGGAALSAGLGPRHLPAAAAAAAAAACVLHLLTRWRLSADPLPAPASQRGPEQNGESCAVRS
ncbi:MFS transporter [Streptomyces sp. NRRL F-5123]|uniref:MFS transporter n=1 Tax=Streptomyces sp. NRRL F-5123 TaxID=1463856 RepID=UPI000693C8DA|nr:MFS transporter [Streptomyces sp. NRRL F-5123]